MMGAVLKRQVKMGRLEKNPVEMVDMPKVVDVRERILTDYEFRKLLNARWEFKNNGTMQTVTLAPHIRLSLLIADYTGMRIGEILAMKWKNVDLINGIIFIPTSKNQSRRNVPIHDELRKILMSQNKVSEFVINLKRKPVKSIRKGFNKAREKAELEDVRIHDFRHRAITRWVKEGKPINTIMAATGHRTISAFLRYANLRQGDIMDLVGKKTEPLPLITFEEFTQAI